MKKKYDVDQDHIYEYRKVYNPNRYELGDANHAGEHSIEGHKWGYIKRRDIAHSTLYTHVRAYCSCGHKFANWHVGKRKKDFAMAEFNEHIRQVESNVQLQMEI